MPPIVLGIDTSSSWCSAALLDGETLFVRRESVGSAHSQKILAMVGAVLDDARIALATCDVLAYAAGPGSFTGLRVAAAVAQGLAYGAELEVASIGTLDAIAHSVSGYADTTRLLVAQDARMGEVYWALFDRVDSRWATIAGPALGPPASLRRALRAVAGADRVDVGCGNAWAIHSDAMADLARQVIHRDAADAADVAHLGAHAWRLHALGDARTAQPLYVRDDVARTTAERAAARARTPASDPVVAD